MELPQMEQDKINDIINEPVTISVDIFSEISRNPFSKFNAEPVQS